LEAAEGRIDMEEEEVVEKKLLEENEDEDDERTMEVGEERWRRDGGLKTKRNIFSEERNGLNSHYKESINILVQNALLKIRDGG
jgi:hypothetical protein